MENLLPVGLYALRACNRSVLTPAPFCPNFSLKSWWAKMDSNHRPHDYQSCALASWAIGPYQLHICLGTFANCQLSTVNCQLSLCPLNWITHRFSKHFSDLRTLQEESRSSWSLLRKEVIQPHLPIRLPCYDFTPITGPTFGRALLAVRLRTSGVPDSHGVTGGVYKARERIHRGMLIRDY